MSEQPQQRTLKLAMTPGFLGVAAGGVFRWSVEWGTWTSLMVFAYQRSGTKTAGILASLMLLVAAVATPVVARFFERFEPIRAARNFFLTVTVVLAATGLVAVANGPESLIWIGGCLTACLFSPSTPILMNVLPSIARGPQGLAAQNAVIGWAESAGVILGSTAGAIVLEQSSSARSGIGAVFGGGALLILFTTGAFARITQHSISTCRDAHDSDDRTPASNPSPKPLASPAVRSLLILTVGAALVIGSLDVLYLPLAESSGLGESRAGLFTAAYGVGGLLSVLGSRVMLGRTPLAPSLAILGLVGAAPIALLAMFQTHAIGCLVLVAISGAARTMYNVIRQLLLQRCAPPGALLRVMGLFQAAMTLAYAVGSLVPWLSQSTRTASFITALLVPVALVLVTRQLRSIDASANVPVTEIALLSTVGVMRSLPPIAIEALARRCELIQFTTSQQIVDEGAHGNHVFVLVDGQVEVIRENTVIATLDRGDFFGEVAVLRNQPRNATVTARSAVQVLSIHGHDFADFVRMHSDVHNALESVMTERDPTAL